MKTICHCCRGCRVSGSKIGSPCSTPHRLICLTMETPYDVTPETSVLRQYQYRVRAVAHVFLLTVRREAALPEFPFTAGSPRGHFQCKARWQTELLTPFLFCSIRLVESLQRQYRRSRLAIVCSCVVSGPIMRSIRLCRPRVTAPQRRLLCLPSFLPDHDTQPRGDKDILSPHATDITDSLQIRQTRAACHRLCMLVITMITWLVPADRDQRRGHHLINLLPSYTDAGGCCASFFPVSTRPIGLKTAASFHCARIRRRLLPARN